MSAQQDPLERLTPIAPDAFRAVLGAVCTPVSVVSTMRSERPYATTVSAFSSLSLDPPLITVALDRGSGLLRMIRATRRFGVSVLADGQDREALALARKGPDKLADIAWTADHGLPRIDGAYAWLVCRVHRVVAGGDHMIVIGLVVHGEHCDAGEPMLYHRRDFAGLRRYERGARTGAG